MAEEKMTVNMPADAAQEEGRVFVVESNRRDEMIKFVLLIVLIIVFPPAAVAVHANECNMHVLISLILVFFFMIPSYIHAIWYCFFRQPTQLTIS
ncbi:hypothetical protein CAEBREN_12185 [Caenorhabditis brenneri]|uniref:Uncharacterized protein n=1 Tax=Caenorhabditis brenneri TaxID=135651 RepID=G0NWF4_CAEBE|nr:hypothetical protein CAEBREN_16158 [Caenorhabditis brenneri]EGT41177.1 hypothetical protein CAEBREN_12185 [Caenorhabditis brenneri]